MTTSEAVVGTWFPSGYYGHFRSRTRNDILQEYRHAASPAPPRKFIRRVRLCPDAHSFSLHDNKHSFPTDASYFDAGMGRRKTGGAFTIFKPDLISWMPHKEEIRKQGASVSLYKLDFQENGPNSKPVEQLISPRIRRRAATQQATDARNKWVSDYKIHLQHGQPNPHINTDFNTGKQYDGSNTNPRTNQYLNTTGRLRRTIPHYLAHTEAARRRVKSAPVTRLSVGDCLVWPTEPLNESIYINNIHDPHDGSCYRFKNPLSDEPPRVVHGRPLYSATVKHTPHAPPQEPQTARTEPTEKKVSTPRPPMSARLSSTTPNRSVVYKDTNEYSKSKTPTTEKQQEHHTTNKSMTPAATAISTFTPIHLNNGLNGENTISPPTISPPIILVT